MVKWKVRASLNYQVYVGRVRHLSVADTHTGVTITSASRFFFEKKKQLATLVNRPMR